MTEGDKIDEQNSQPPNARESGCDDKFGTLRNLTSGSIE